MKHIYVNLKRFDVPKTMNGVNQIAPIEKWAETIVKNIQPEIKKYSNDNVEFTMFFPEAHIILANMAKDNDCPLNIGCQGVYREDLAVGANFGAFTTNRPATAAKAISCDTTIIGHCEERKDKLGILQMANVLDKSIVNRVLNQEVKCAINAGLKVLYCIGETAEEQENWQEILTNQLEIGLDGVDKTKVVIAYEPVWAIGPGKTPPDKDYIAKIAKFVKKVSGGMDIVYGGGLKADNAAMLASINEIDGGLIALTRFSGDIGFYPEEYLEIVHLYINN